MAPESITKTVFMIYRTPKFCQTVGEMYSFDRPSNSKQPNPMRPKVVLQRNIWSFTVEAIMEYCRISFDLFSSSKPISLLSIDAEEKILSLWYENDQCLEAVWKAFSTEAVSTSFLDLNSSGLPGLFSSTNVLQLPCRGQAPGSGIGNIGRVIVFGSGLLRKFSGWLPGLVEQLAQPPQEAGYLPIDSSEWFFLDIDYPTSTGSAVEEIDLISGGPHTALYLKVPMNNSRAIFRAVMRLAERNLNLASTLVQEIPMKEEANVSSSSSMYGVELLHEARAHEFLKSLDLADRLYVRPQTGETGFQEPPSGLSKTLGINWVTPRATDNLLVRYSIGAFRVTMAAVNNRASICLAQFVLGGRCVVLAHKQYCGPPVPDGSQSPGDVFLLLCHGSVMYLHVLAAAAPLSHSPVLPVAANLPQAPEDHYRLAAFIKNFLRPACLAPASVSSNYPVAPKISALQLVERFTRYLPLRNGATVLGDIEIAAQLFEHLPKDFLEPREYFECQKAIGLISASIQSQVANEAPSDLVCSLPVAMALELDYLLLQYADLSVEHSLLSTDLRKRLDSISLANKRLSKLVQKATNLLVSGNATPGSPLQQLTEIARKLATSQPNPSSVTSSVSDSKITFGGNSGSNITFASCPIDTFMQHLTAMSRKPVPSRPEFAGVLAAGNSKGPLPLYTGLKGEDN